ncbi:GDP-mannose 4,6-dehydratase [Williamsia herbipolensis]|uniref:GDP-mannose 4,6-dehydratase n=1 Tax=Williamsia herbipolensis TaxID=1603258 RepID=UPI001EF12BA1|nr:GDP-mannose 4,6-dehydratase [Williamsia herbipolensis]
MISSPSAPEHSLRLRLSMLDDARPDPRVALVTGIYGQDGSYLAERLLADGWEVHGAYRPGTSMSETAPADLTGAHLHGCDLVDDTAAADLVAEVTPGVIFHLAGASSVGRSWQAPVATARVNAVATTALLDAAMGVADRTGDRVVFVNASSAEIFGTTDAGRLDESTPIAPSSPYGATKAYTHLLGAVYRDRGLAVNNAILFNHESPRRGTEFVTGKIAHGVAAIARGERDRLSLGDMSARRDWGWAPDYADAMYRMAVRSDARGDDFVIATGTSHSVRDFVAAGFAAVGIDDWEHLVEIDSAHVRPVDPSDFVGDAGHARAVLGWAPTVQFGEIVRNMVESHMAQSVAAR